MFYLINTFMRDDSCAGATVSRHRTLEAAKQADTVLQRRVRKSNGTNSYIPTRIVEVKRRLIMSFVNHIDIVK